MTGSFVQNYYDLEVFKKAFEASLEVHKESLCFPQMEQYALANQIRRASKGICANIAEGFAKQQASRPEFKRYLLIALGSAEEMDVWIRYCKELEYIDSVTSKKWEDEYRAIARMIQSLHSKV